jgi:hypothetical protein
MQRLRRAARRAGAQRAPWGRVSMLVPSTGAGDQAVTHILARQDRGDGQESGADGLHVFQAMHGKIDLAVMQPLVQLLGP